MATPKHGPAPKLVVGERTLVTLADDHQRLLLGSGFDQPSEVVVRCDGGTVAIGTGEEMRQHPSQHRDVLADQDERRFLVGTSLPDGSVYAIRRSGTPVVTLTRRLVG